MNDINFTFSDLIAGYVTQFDRGTDTYTVKTSGGQEFQIKLKSNTYAQLVRNLGDPYQDSTGQMRDMLVPGRYPVHLRRLLPGGERHRSSRRSSSSSWAARPTSTSSSGPTGG